MNILAAALALYVSQVTAFSVSRPSIASTGTRLMAEYVPLEGEGKINLKIDLESEKVATMASLSVIVI